MANDMGHCSCKMMCLKFLFEMYSKRGTCSDSCRLSLLSSEDGGTQQFLRFQSVHPLRVAFGLGLAGDSVAQAALLCALRCVPHVELH